MSWITAIWSVSAGACLVMALMHIHVWCRDRRSWANLFFSTMVFTVVGFTVLELVAMRTRSIDVYARILAWTPSMYALGVVGSLGFVHFYFGTGRRPLLAAAIGLRGAVLVVTPFVGLNLHITSLASLETVLFLGEPVSIPGVWESSRWILLAQAATVAQLAYVGDASLRLWRTGRHEARKRALLVGGSLLLFLVITSVYSAVVASGLLRHPFILSLPFLITLLAMSYELSGEMLRALSLTRALRERELELSLAADSAHLGIWMRDLATGEIRGSPQWRTIFGFGPTEPLDLAAFMDRVHADDRAAVERALAESAIGEGGYALEYRIVRPDGHVRWIASHGRYEFDADRKPTALRGISLDVTARKQAEAELQQRRDEVAHLARVTTLGQISGSLAHELGQPLGAILANAGAADLHLQRATPNLDQVRAIIADIRRDDLRAGEIIHGIRAFLQRKPPEMTSIRLIDLAQDVVKLVSADAAARTTSIALEFPPDLPPVQGDRIQLQQVLLNLVVNGLDAMATCPAEDRRLALRAQSTDPHTVEVSVVDAGAGLSPADRQRLFEPFHTTKVDGLGLGLSICRSILETHRGTISIENNVDRGVTARFTLPAAPPL